METIFIELPKTEETLRFKCNFNNEDKMKVIEIGSDIVKTLNKKQACWEDARIQELISEEKEKYKAQGLNDFIVYSVHALGSLSAGVFITLTSWKIMNIIYINKIHIK